MPLSASSTRLLVVPSTRASECTRSRSGSSPSATGGVSHCDGDSGRSWLMSWLRSSSVTYSPRAPGRVMSTRPLEGFMLTPGFPGLVSGLAPRGSGNVLGAECQLSKVRAAPQAAMVAYVSRSHSRMPVSEPPKPVSHTGAVSGTGRGGDSAGREPEGDLAGGGFRGIRAVDEVELGFQGQIGPNRAGGSLLHRVGAAGELPEG